MKKLVTSSHDILPYETRHADLVRALAPECMVLLKNDGTLPLREPCRLALYGGGARRTVKGGTGSGDVNVRRFVNVEEGLEAAGFEITTKRWLDAYDAVVSDAKERFFGELRQEAKALGVNPLIYGMGRMAPDPEYDFPLDGEGDTAVYVLSRISGEGADRTAAAGDIALTAGEVRDILALREKYRRFVLVLNTGGMVDLTPVRDVGTVLSMGQLGSASGDALADVLLGRAYPSGKLTMTWAPLDAYPSTAGFGDPDDTDYREGVYVGYRYFDTANVPVAVPFGFGLGYSFFDLGEPTAELTGTQVRVTVPVSNAGGFKGREVVQVYVSAPEGRIPKPMQELRGFAKTPELAPGESCEVKITFDAVSMASFDPSRTCWVLEEGDYILRVGTSSRDTRIAGILRLSGEAVTRRVRSIVEKPGFEDMVLPARKLTPAERAQADAAPVIELAPEFIPCREVRPSGRPEELPLGERRAWVDVMEGRATAEEFAAGLTDPELAKLCAGDYRESDDILEIIGNASSTVAGAAGETSGKLRSLGLPTAVMADGPAGLRLSREYKNVDGRLRGSTPLQGDNLLLYDPEERATMLAAGGDDGLPEYYQHCTAMPIGTCVAQSWNEELAEKLGDMMGEEMELFGVHIWLAPALNIQRSPLCGRDFEYYSEDPLVSGVTAAAVTRGVQAHSGRYTTIKHFACNNQETNRYFSNSRLSERALREIYLRGFEECLRRSAPGFVMSSYNLLNGEHTCTSPRLLTGFLRDECCFGGVVMTDWLVTGGMGRRGSKWPCASAAGNVKAGNDITMPGMPGDIADMMEALGDDGHPYHITRADLGRCAVRVLRALRAINLVDGDMA